MEGHIRGIVGGLLERILERMGHATKREQALVLELAQVRDQLGAATARGDAATAVAEERAVLLTAAAVRAKSAEKQLGLERSERDLTAKQTVRLELRVQALNRRREQLQADLDKFQEQLARADVSGRIRELQEEKAQLQQRLADLQTYSSFRIEPFAATSPAEEKQVSANPR